MAAEHVQPFGRLNGERVRNGPDRCSRSRLRYPFTAELRSRSTAEAKKRRSRARRSRSERPAFPTNR